MDEFEPPECDIDYPHYHQAMLAGDSIVIDLRGKQPPPIHRASRPVWEMVIEDMKARDEHGRREYGTPLQTHNGRDGLWDIYEELLDAAVYIRKEIAEREER